MKTSIKPTTVKLLIKNLEGEARNQLETKVLEAIASNCLTLGAIVLRTKLPKTVVFQVAKNLEKRGVLQVIQPA